LTWGAADQEPHEYVHHRVLDAAITDRTEAYEAQIEATEKWDAAERRAEAAERELTELRAGRISEWEQAAKTRIAIARAERDVAQEAQVRAETERDAAIRARDEAASSLEEERAGGKYYMKARVYGAIAAEYQKALQAFADRGEALARAALDWRHSNGGGVPISAVNEIGRLLDVAERMTREHDAALRAAFVAGQQRILKAYDLDVTGATTRSVEDGADDYVARVKGEGR
jgi:hypothetical protein